jgi:hypothetical protein
MVKIRTAFGWAKVAGLKGSGSRFENPAFGRRICRLTTCSYTFCRFLQEVRLSAEICRNIRFLQKFAERYAFLQKIAVVSLNPAAGRVFDDTDIRPEDLEP